MVKFEISETSHRLAPRKVVPICNEAEATQNCPAETQDVESQNLVGSYVVIAFDSKLWVGFVDHKDEALGDYFICFLHPHGKKPSYSFPDNRNEECFTDQSQIKGVLPAPTLSGRSARIRYSFPMDSLNSLMS